MKTWDEVKQAGSTHYKAPGVEVIDLLRHIKAHPTLTVVEIKALSDIIKYSYRCLNRGISDSDLHKIIHYAEIAGAANAESDEK